MQTATLATLELSRTDIEHLPHFRRKTASEYSSACPFCGQGEDRFIFWPKDNAYWCRQCNVFGYVKGFTGDIQELEIEHKRTREQEVRYAMYLMQQSQDTPYHYHEMLTPDKREYWYHYGLTDETIDQRVLGYTPICPTWSKSASITIPVFYKNKVLSIRHRLLNPPKPGDKYRPHFKGLPPVMYNADILLGPLDFLVIVEGEAKTIVLCQYGIPALGIPGVETFNQQWISMFCHIRKIFIVLDPGAAAKACKLANLLGKNALHVLPTKLDNQKPDDWLINGGTREAFLQRIGAGQWLM